MLSKASACLSSSKRLRAATLLGIFAASAIAHLATYFFFTLPDAVNYPSPAPRIDIDHWVIHRAARCMARGSSPFSAHGYRYTPILALLHLLLLPHPGVVILFWILSNWLCGVLSLLIMAKLRASAATQALLYAWWSWHPVPIIIAIRGSPDSFSMVFVLLAVYALLSDWTFAAGLTLGFSFHLRMSMIYLLIPFYFSRARTAFPFKPAPRRLLRSLLPTAQQASLASGAALGFAVPTLLFFRSYGWDFLKAATLYHVGRVDRSHSFSIHFLIQMVLAAPEAQKLAIALRILNSALVTLVGLRLAANNLLLALFSSVCTFVALNTVVTAQYFVWWMALLPAAAATLPWTLAKGIVFCLLSASSAIINLIYHNYQIALETGEPHYQKLGILSSVFCLSQMAIVFMFLMSNKSRKKTKLASQEPSVAISKKHA